MDNPLPQIYKNLFGPESKFKPEHLPLLTRLLVSHGREYTTVGITRGEHKQQKLGMCYMNSLHLALANGYEYCEGYAMTEKVKLPLEHAWCWDNEKKRVIDVTWDEREGETYYFGLHFPANVAAEFMTKIGTYGLSFWKDRNGKATKAIIDYLEKKNENAETS